MLEHRESGMIGAKGTRSKLILGQNGCRIIPDMLEICIHSTIYTQMPKRDYMVWLWECSQWSDSLCLVLLQFQSKKSQLQKHLNPCSLLRVCLEELSRPGRKIVSFKNRGNPQCLLHCKQVFLLLLPSCWTLFLVVTEMLPTKQPLSGFPV